jgi:hypothetical protein
MPLIPYKRACQIEHALFLFKVGEFSRSVVGSLHRSSRLKDNIPEIVSLAVSRGRHRAQRAGKYAAARVGD